MDSRGMKLSSREGTASDTTGLGATTAAQLVATTSGATGNAGGIFVTSDRALNLGALSAGGNIDISTTGASALTVSGAISTDRKTTPPNSSHDQTSTAGLCLALNNTITSGSSLV